MAGPDGALNTHVRSACLAGAAEGTWGSWASSWLRTIARFERYQEKAREALDADAFERPGVRAAP